MDLRPGFARVRMARDAEPGGVSSQDRGFAEASREVRHVARSARRWPKFVSANSRGPNAPFTRGIDATDWFHMDREFCDNCLDPREYRPQVPAERFAESANRLRNARDYMVLTREEDKRRWHSWL